MVQELLGKPVRQLIRERIIKRIALGQRINGYIIVNPSSAEAKAYADLISKTLASLNQRVFYTEVTDYNEAEFAVKNANMDPIGTVFLARPLGFKGEDKLIEEVNSEKDADMLTSVNIGKLAKGNLHYLSGTSKAVNELLAYYQIDVTGKKALVIGRSVSVGLPISLLLLKRNAEVSIVHSRVQAYDIHHAAQESDIIVLASGKRGLFDKEDVKKNQIILDCGYHEDGHGDIDFVPEEASFYTPVPRGIGPITIIGLIENAFYLLYGEEKEDE